MRLKASTPPALVVCCSCGVGRADAAATRMEMMVGNFMLTMYLRNKELGLGLSLMGGGRELDGQGWIVIYNVIYIHVPTLRHHNSDSSAMT